MQPSRLANVADYIRKLISDRVATASTVTSYRTPLVAFARADDPGFDELPRRIPGHLHPRDLLPGARSGAQSVCAFFLPFTPQIVRSNARGELASEEWARAYVETNALLADICAMLEDELGQRGIHAAWEPPTHNFDPVRLVSAWSHKSVAALAGLGQFGHHHMLITRAGCAGRLGSVVLDVEVAVAEDGSTGNAATLCTYDQGCRECIRRCPVGALTEEGLDRARCYARCLENDARWPQWTADVCGKCATGPCAIL